MAVEDSWIFADALRAGGVAHELVIIPDAPHAFDLEPQQRDLRPVVLEFFDKHSKPGKGTREGKVP